MTIARYVKPLSSVPRVSVSDSLSQVIARTTGSHDAALVFDADGRYRGLVYPYHVLYKKRPPVDATAESALVVAPYVTRDSAVESVIRHMLSMRLYTLPVMDARGTPMGVVTAKSLLKALLDVPAMRQKLTDSISIQEPFVVYDTATVKDVYPVMRREKTNRAVVVDPQGRAVGMITRRDIYMAFLSPSPGERLRKQGGNVPSRFFDREWVTKFDYPVKSYMTIPLKKIPVTEPGRRIIEALVASPRGSVVVVDIHEKPVGILSLRHMLKSVTNIFPEESVETVIVDRRKVLSAFRQLEMEDLLRKYSRQMRYRIPVVKIELVVDALRKAGHHVMMYEASLRAITEDNRSVSASAKEYSLRDSVREAGDRLLRRIGTD